MPDFETYEQLAEQVDLNGGVMTATMGQLRDVHGAGKLGSYVVSAIHEQLDSLGLGHAPVEMPRDQWERVLVYRKRTPVGRVVQAVVSVTKESDSILKEAVGNNGQSSDIIRRIRELVCD